MKTIEGLRKIEWVIAGGSLPKARRAWGGADVVISKTPNPNEGTSSFYPSPRYVVSPHALELSWLFEALRDAFYAEDRLDSLSKIEFFGRLANAADRCIREDPDVSAHEVCAAVLHESFAIYDEMENGAFRCFALAVDNEIVDDYVDDSLRTGFTCLENTRKFFSSRGIDLPPKNSN